MLCSTSDWTITQWLSTPKVRPRTKNEPGWSENKQKMCQYNIQSTLQRALSETSARPQRDFSQTSARPQPHLNQTSARPQPDLSRTSARTQLDHRQTLARPQRHRSQTSVKPQRVLSETSAKPQPDVSETSAMSYKNYAPEVHCLFASKPGGLREAIRINDL